MAKEHVVRYRDEQTNREFHLDLANGNLYDLQGNQVAQWKPVENNNLALCADMLHDEDNQKIVHAMSKVDPERARLMSARLSGDESMLMSLGPGDVHLPSALPNFASGYRNEAPMADMFAPPLQVDNPVDDYYQYAKEDAFQRALPVAGAPAGSVPEISPRVGNQRFKTIERAIGGFVSTQTEAAQDAALRVRQATSRRVKLALDIEREIRVAKLATTAANWDAGCVGTLGAAFKWNGGASSDPVKDIQDRMLASWGAVTAMIFPEPAYYAFIRNPAVRAYYASKNSTAPVPKASELASILGIPPIYVAKMQVMTGANSKGFIWGNDVVMVRQPDEMPPTGQDDVMTAATFRWKAGNVRDGMASSGGFIVREFFVEDRGSLGGNKLVVVHHDAEVLTSQFVGGLIKGALQ